MVKLSSLGDVIQTLPVLHDIQSRYPDCQIDWVVEEAFADMLRTVPAIHTVIPIAQRRWRKSFWRSHTRAAWRDFWLRLRSQRYDVVIDFQGLIKSARVARMAELAPGGYSVTYANGSDWCAYEWPVRWLLQRSVPMEKTIHAVARYRSLAARALGHDAAQWLSQPPVYPWPPEPSDQPPVAVLAFGTTRADNLWPKAQWQALGRYLMAQGMRLAVPQSSDWEWDWAQQLAQSLGPACQVWPRMSLAELKTRMARATLVVGVDSGLSHLAIALDLPVVQIFSQPRVARAGPVGRTYQRAAGGEQAPDADTVCQLCTQVLAAAAQRQTA